MKKVILTGSLLCGLILSPTAMQAQSLKNLLNSAAAKEAVTAVTGGKNLSTANLAGTWTYVNPAVKLESDNALKNVAAGLATGEMEKKLKEICAKAGIEEHMFNYTFKADNTFTSLIKGKTLNGTYSIDKEQNVLTLQYGKTGNLKLMTLKAQPVISNDQLTLLFEADKLLDFISKISALSDNSTLKAVSTLAEQYDGMMLGFDLKK